MTEVWLVSCNGSKKKKKKSFFCFVFYLTVPPLSLTLSTSRTYRLRVATSWCLTRRRQKNKRDDVNEAKQNVSARGACFRAERRRECYRASPEQFVADQQDVDG